MKKVFFALAIVVALGLTSCSAGSGIDANGVTDPEQYVCWEITATGSYAGESATETSYFWGTLNQVELLVEETKAVYDLLPGKYTIHAKHVNKSEAECYDADYEY